MSDLWTSYEMPKVGEKVLITAPSWVKRRWWQVWKPRWTQGPVETREYEVTHSATSNRGA